MAALHGFVTTTRGALAVYAATLGVAIVLVAGPVGPFVEAHRGALFLALWLYVPLAAIRASGLEWREFGLTRVQGPGSVAAFAGCVALLVPYSVLLEGWLRLVEQRSVSPHLPDNVTLLIAHQLLAVAVPEELFFRGYLQTCFETACRKPPPAGAPALPVAAIAGASAFFALAHPLLGGGVASLAVFFPGLLFGYLRWRSGSLVYPVLFHALCNVYRTTMAG